MTTYRFAGFAFDSQREELCRDDGELLALRPKTRMLMRLLIEHRDQPLARDELFQRLWPTTHAGSNNLFQAISELRSVFKPLDPIRTIPNLGYQWAVPVRRKRSWRALASAAALVFAVTATVILSLPGKVPHGSHLPPAYRAFLAGVEQLEDGKPEQAATQFELALAENPDFSEAQLLLAQSLIYADRLVQANAVLEALLASQAGHHDAYAQMTAMQLMGEIQQRVGKEEATLDWTRRAFENAEQSGYLCAAADLESRLIDLDKLRGVNAPRQSEAVVLAQAEALPAICAQIPASLKSSAIEACHWQFEAVVGVDAAVWRGFKLS
jgi:DNA-binding winged helix-turn-helix (wHTH) protein